MSPHPGFEPSLPLELEVTPELVSAAYKRALRLGLYWRLKPEERAILYLSRRLRAIKSPLLKEIVFKILEKVWPEKARLYEAFKLGTRMLTHKVNIALKIGAKTIAQALLRLPPILVLQLGYTYMHTPALYRPKLDE